MSTQNLPNPPRIGSGSYKKNVRFMISFLNEKELKEFDEAITEERQRLQMPNINRSSILRRLAKKWLEFKVKA
jgi:hypothetical protein